jgi:F0F1-type ATP synthase assembly protein I
MTVLSNFLGGLFVGIMFGLLFGYVMATRRSENVGKK